MNLTNLSIKEQDLSINHTKLYLCNERNTKFIYHDLSTQKVNGLINLLNGKLIEIVKKKIVNARTYYKVKCQNEIVGWIHLEDSIRVYRLPKMLGKCSEYNKVPLEYINQEQREEIFKNKLVEAKYIIEDEKYKGYLINLVGKNSQLIPVSRTDFHRLLVPPKGEKITLAKGTELYESQFFRETISCLSENETVEVVGFYKHLNEIKIVTKGKKYWVLKNTKNLQSESSVEFYDIDLLDKFIYLKNQNQVLKSEQKKQEKFNEVIRNNICINNDFQSLFLKKYLGDIDEIN